MLRGEGPPAAEAAVVLNAAAAIYVSELRGSYQEAIALAREALRDGAGVRALDQLRRSFGPPPAR